YDQAVPYNLDSNLLNTQSLGFDNAAQAYTFGDTYLLGPNTINSFRLAVNRTEVIRVAGDIFSGPDLGININPYNSKQIRIIVTNGFTIGPSGFGPNRTTTYQSSDDLSLIRGPHQLAFGATLAHWRNNLNAHPFENGVFTFNGQVLGLGLA